MKITNKEEILNNYRFENFKVGDYLIMLNESLTDGNIIVKTGEHKAIRVDTGEVYLIEPEQLFIKIEQQLIFQPSVEELTAISMQTIYDAKKENKDIAIYDWESITNKSIKLELELEEEGLKEEKEEITIHDQLYYNDNH